MKTIFKDMSISLLTGTSFAIGVMLVLFAADRLQKESEDDTWTDIEDGILADRPSVTITSHSVKPSTMTLTIVGEVRNDSQYDWKRIWFDWDIFADTALVNSCDNVFDDLPAKSTRSFEFRCRDVAGTNLPENIRYEVRVKSGIR